MSHCEDHFSKSFRSFWSDSQSAEDVMGRYTTQSSAKRLTLEFSPTGKSLMYTRKSRGPNTVPWGTPDRTSAGLEGEPWITTDCCLPCLAIESREYTVSIINTYTRESWVWWRPQKTVRHAKTALLFHRAQSAKYALHCAQYAKCTGLNRRWNDLKNQQNLLFVKVFIWRIKFPCKSMAFSNFSYNTLFNATSVKLRLCALSMQKGRCGSWVGKIKSEWKIITQVWRPYLRK